jgi:hypothetical protein
MKIPIFSRQSAGIKSSAIGAMSTVAKEGSVLQD